MINKDILKSAFIDAFYEESSANHRFSPVFENKMKKLIKSQSGFLKLINTTAKRVACALLIIIISLTTVACSVKEIREPILEEIEKFFVNANELLKGTKADEVADLFPESVTKIIATDFISKPHEKYEIKEEEKIKEFLNLISETYFGEPGEFTDLSDSSIYWTFDFLNAENESAMKIQMCSEERFGAYRIIIEQGGKEKNYYIPETMYRKILSFTSRPLYLHDSSIEHPSDEALKEIRENAIKNLTDDDLKKLKNTVRHAHYATEALLLENVSILKSQDSIYWEYFISGEEFVDPISNYEGKFGLYNDYNVGVYSGVISDIEYIIANAKNEEISNNFKIILELWKTSAKEHNIEGLFSVHEYIHDYDYFLYNYPTKYVYSDSADYQGTDDYFGHLR